jgi:hypothetical protein
VHALLPRQHGADVAEREGLVADLGRQRAAQRLGARGGEVGERALGGGAAALDRGTRVLLPPELWG